MPLAELSPASVTSPGSPHTGIRYSVAAFISHRHRNNALRVVGFTALQNLAVTQHCKFHHGNSCSHQDQTVQLRSRDSSDTPVSIHKCLLCERSKILEKLIEGASLPFLPIILNLNTSHRILVLFACWIYTQLIWDLRD
ncbi:hypothetical protein Q7P37_001080 [Cladosporium fusiforme]